MKKYKNRIVAGVVLGLLILMSVAPAIAVDPSITLYQRSPIPAGGVERIAWNHTESFEPNVTLELFKDGTLNMTITSDTNIGTPDLGIYDWGIPLSLEAGMYQIKITGNTTSGSEVTNTTDLEIMTATADGCRWCHYDNPYTHHLLTSPGARYSCENCHPIMNGALFIERNCLNCHNGTAFWVNPIIDPGEPHLEYTPPVINSVVLSTNTPNTGDLILVTVNVTDNIWVSSVSVGDVLLTRQNGDITAIFSGNIVAIDGTHQISVSAYDIAGFEVFDQSNWYTATMPIITLNMTSTIQAGSLTPIQWNYTGSFEPNVTLELFKDGTLNMTITSDTNIGSSGQGVYDWAIPLSLETGMYQVKITGNTTSGSEITNTTDLEITTATADGCRGCHYDPPEIHHSLMTSSPKQTLLGCVDCHPTVIERNCLNCHNGTTFWGSPFVHPGEPHLGETPPVINNVTLSTNTPNTGDLILVTVNATDDDVIYRVTANGGRLTQQGNDIWTGSITAIEGTHPVNVSASDTSGRTTLDDSASYTAVTPSITVTSPMTEDRWVRGTMQTITWTYTGNLGSSATVELLEHGYVSKTWNNVLHANGIGSLDWTIPSRFETSTYKIRVSAGGYSNTTGDFNIVKR